MNRQGFDIPECVIKTGRPRTPQSSNSYVVPVHFSDNVMHRQHVVPPVEHTLLPNRFLQNVDVTERPVWLDRFELLPSVYRDAILFTKTEQGLNTGLIHKLFLSSGLPNSTLRSIWCAVNRAHPGWLTPSELVLALALIALTQQFGQQPVHVLVTHLPLLPHPPIPRIHMPQGTDPLPISTEQTIPNTNDMSASLTSPCEDDWSDFVTTNTVQIFGNLPSSVVPVTSPSNQPTQIISNSNDPPVSDEFGEFQAGTNSYKDTSPARCAESIKTSPVRPNYNLSLDSDSASDPESVLQNEWMRCLTQCIDVCQQSQVALSELCTSNDRQEFSAVPEGNEFLLDILAVFQLVHHIRSSILRLNLSNTNLQSHLAKLDELISEHEHLMLSLEQKTMFEQSSPTSLSKSASISVSLSDPQSACGVCLVPFHLTRSLHVTILAGRHYHTPCANFWINRVQLSLPALQNPE